MIHKNRGNRRKQDWKKAYRKKQICKDVYHSPFYAFDGMYRKGKIHCSCPMCAVKTGNSLNRSNGPVDSGGRSCRLAMTSRRYKKNYKHSDIQKIDSLICKETEFDVSGV